MPEQDIRHLFVETNWVHDYAAPAHHKVPAAFTLLERAQRGDFILHIPNVSFAEARQSIQTKCQLTAPEFIGTFGGHTRMANSMTNRLKTHIDSRKATSRTYERS